MKIPAGFDELDVRPLAAEQSEKLVRQWFDAAEDEGIHARDGSDDGEGLVRKLREPPYDRPEFRSLLGVPLLVTLLCVIVRLGSRIPRDRASFYDECLRQLLDTWIREEKEVEPLLRYEGAIRTLRILAHRIQVDEPEAGEDGLAPEEFSDIQFGLALHEAGLWDPDLEDPGELIAWLRECGVLVELGDSTYGFAHKQFREYLTALHLHAAEQDELLDPALDDYFGDDSRWKEVVQLFLGLDVKPLQGRFLKRLLRHERAGRRPARVLDVLRSMQPRLWADYFDALGVLGDGETKRRRQLAQLLRQIDADEILPHLEELESHPDRQLQALARDLRQRARTAGPGARQDVLLVFAEEDRAAAAELARALEDRALAVRPKSAALRRGQSPTLPMVATAQWALALRGAGSPKGERRSRDLLQLLEQRGCSVHTVLLSGSHGRVPRGAVDLRSGLDDEGLDRVQAALEPEMEAAVSTAKPEVLTPAKAYHPEPGTVLIDSDLGMRFDYVPGGTFTMGEGAASIPDVRVSAFWLGRVPVTNAQYRHFIDETGGREPEYWRDDRFNGPNHPVVAVSWHEAVRFCAWLTDRFFSLEARLPTEAEWEFAARPDGRPYPWGKQKPTKKLAHYNQDRDTGGAAPVGAFPDGRGKYGHLDLAGNVMEWCQDLWCEKPHAAKQRENPLWTPELSRNTDNDERLIRGGSWNDPAEFLQASLRGRANGAHFLVGFRVALSPANR